MAALRVLVGTVAVLVARVAWSCPLCHTAVGDQVRAGLLDSHLARNVSGMLLPFPVLAVIIAVIHFGLPLRRRDATKRGREPAGARASGTAV